MRHPPLPFLIWVLLPVVVCGLLGHILASRETGSQAMEATTRMGAVATHLFTEEMGGLAAELVEEAPILTNPDTGSPLIQAAQRGDTVAALGASSGSLTLSVALAEAGEDSTHIRATTAPFIPGTPDLVASRTGFAVALFLRGRRVLATSQDFGPSELAYGEAPPVPTPLPPGAALFPLAPSQGGPAPTQLLVGPLRGGSDSGFPWLGGACLLVALGLTALAWHTPPTRPQKGRIPALRLLALSAIPLGILWGVLIEAGTRVSEGAEETLREDMVRVLALMKEEGDLLSPHALGETTGFSLLRVRDGRSMESTLPGSPMADELLALPLPPPTFPVLGTIKNGEESWEYAHLREGSSGGLFLMAPSPTEAKRRFSLLMAALGALASLTSLGFLLQQRRIGDT